eukprot:3022780-Prymnesium_polylepis.1
MPHKTSPSRCAWCSKDSSGLQCADRMMTVVFLACFGNHVHACGSRNALGWRVFCCRGGGWWVPNLPGGHDMLTSHKCAVDRGGNLLRFAHINMKVHSRPRDDPGVPRPWGLRAGGHQTAPPRRVA